MSALAALLLLVASPVGLAVERDGTILERDELVLDAGAGVLRWREREYPLDGFYLVEDPGGACLWTPDLESRLRGYELLARARTLQRAEDLFGDAIRYKDPELARRLFELAQDNGLDGKETEKARKRLLRLEKRPGKRSDKADGVRQEAAALPRLYADLLFERTRPELAKEGPTGLRMLREVLRVAPDHAGAQKAIADRAPKDFPLGDARLWLEWHLDVESRGARLASNESFAMRQALKYWRKDVYGIEVGPVIVITPVKDARILGRMLGCCRLTTDLLASQFASFEKRRDKTEALRIFLFENREEYKKQTVNFQPWKDPSFLEFTAGHYSPDEGLSRLFWVTDQDAESRIIGTAVHELTHHWLAQANPAYNHVEGRRSPRTPGFWIVEGFADFMQEGVYDLDKGTSSLFDRRAASLDTVASMAKTGKLIPWQLLYTGTAVHFWALPQEREIVVRRRWLLGSMRMSLLQLWYFQSAATCQYLYHAENGKHRKALLQYLIDHYTRKADRMPIQAAFGMTPSELGAKVTEFSKAVAKGWEPGSDGKAVLDSSGKGAGNDGK